MADKRIVDLDAVNTSTELLDTNLEETSLVGGTGSRKVTWLERMQYVRAALGFGGATAGAIRTMWSFVKEVTGIAGSTDTAVLTVTVPNALHEAAIRVLFLITKGTGGAIGEGESASAYLYTYVVTRTPGVSAAIALLPNAIGSSGAVATVAGGSALGPAIDDGGMLAGPSGGSSATQTFDIRVNIVSGVAGNKCTMFVEVLNKNASGITVS